MEIAAKRNAPKIICWILATISSFVVAWFFISSFWFWVGFEFIAAILVFIGCSGEWYLHVHPAGKAKREKDKHHNLEARYIAAVVVGVFMEVFALGHSIREGVKLEGYVASANERAGTATNMAAQAIEKAAKFDLARAMAEQQTAKIQSNNLELQKQLQPRIITMEQITNFIFLTEKIQKMPVKISFVFGRNETANYAYQIRNMLNKANFPSETNAAVWGINPDQTHITRQTSVEDTNWASVVLYVYGTNGIFYRNYFPKEFTNGYFRPIVSGSDNSTIGEAILSVIQQLKINAVEDSNSEVVKSNEFELYIMDKAN